MKTLRVSLRQIGNSYGFVVPKPILSQMDFEGDVQMAIEGDALVLRKPPRPARAGWAEAAMRISQKQEDVLVMGEFPNDDDADLKW